MAYTFVLHQGEDQTREGWHESEELKEGNEESKGISSIKDLGVGGNEGKIGTSIPTPLARIYLFDSAFKFINARGKNNNNIAEANRVTNYDKLVSHTLDLLQFLFEHGGVPESFHFTHWRGVESAEDLYHNKGNSGHILLSTSLNMAVKGTPFEQEGVTLIEYITDNGTRILLGGTSPMTLVYTSPNISRLLNEKQIRLLANDKSPLFSDTLSDVKHLKDRSLAFRQYMKWLVKEYGDTFLSDDYKNSHTAPNLNPFYDYVEKQTEDIEKGNGDYYLNIADDDSSNIKIASHIILRYDHTPLDVQASHFMMAPNRKVYGDDRIAPLVLPVEDGGQGCDGWNYTSETDKWSTRTRVDYWAIQELTPEERRLPINGSPDGAMSTFNNAWVTNSDFFAECLVDIGYEVNAERFLFPKIEGCKSKYLLPIKKEYFNYFDIADLEKNLTMRVKEKNGRGEPQVIEASLYIPLLNKPDGITLKRRYAIKADDKHELVTGLSSGFALGVFPFYRLDDSKYKNRYSIYLYSSFESEEKVQVSFYRKDQGRSIAEGQVFDADTINNKEIKGKGVVRTSFKEGISKVYNLSASGISNGFDLIEVKVENNYGLVIPKWTDVSQINIDKESIYAIDFGTSNTYISYLDGSEAKAFTIHSGDQQMVLLNEPGENQSTSRTRFHDDKAYGAAPNAAAFLREFMPSLIGDNSVDEQERIEYPIKTATVEKENLSKDDLLFNAINIGFNIDIEQQQYNHSKFLYYTNLKWRAEESKIKNNVIDPKDLLRVQAFCDQTLWMIKNKIILNGTNRDQIEIIYFYPDSMSEEIQELYKASWDESAKKVFRDCGFDIEIHGELEAVAPYYALLKHNNDLYTCTSANIDIGGGTTDIFVLDRHTSAKMAEGIDGYAYESSIRFAGNDIWGANSIDADKHKERNGFVTMMVKNLGKDAALKYEKVSNKEIMSEVASFFFKNDSDFQFSERIKSIPELKYILFIHYSAIVKYFTDILKAIREDNPDFIYPKVVNFTGKGSEYIKMIAKSTDLRKISEEISNLTYDLFKSFGVDLDKEFKEGFDVTFVDNPKALTADGGVSELLMARGEDANKITLYDREKAEASSRRSARRAEDTGMKVPYIRIGKKCLGFDTNGQAYKIADAVKLENQVMASFNDFISVVTNAEYQKTLGVKVTDNEIDELVKYARNSYQVFLRAFMTKNQARVGDDLTENLFFFALRNSLIDYSNYVVDNKLNKK